jgi:hypothetical protein
VLRQGLRAGAVRAYFARGLDGLVSQFDRLRCERKRTQTERDCKKRVQPPSGLHEYIVIGPWGLGKWEPGFVASPLVSRRCVQFLAAAPVFPDNKVGA